MRARKRSSHTFTVCERAALGVSVARLFTLRGANIRHPHPLIASWHLKADTRIRALALRFYVVLQAITATLVGSNGIPDLHTAQATRRIFRARMTSDSVPLKPRARMAL